MSAEPPSSESDQKDMERIVTALREIEQAADHLLNGHYRGTALHVLGTLAEIQREARNVARYLKPSTNG